MRRLPMSRGPGLYSSSDPFLTHFCSNYSSINLSLYPTTHKRSGFPSFSRAWLREVKVKGPLGEITTACSCCSFVGSFFTGMPPGFQLFGSGFKDLVLGIWQGSVAFCREADLSFLPNYSEFLFILCIKKCPCCPLSICS